MEKGKLGLRLSFYGVTAFILAFLGYSTLLFLLAGVVIIVEKNEWATRQVIEAFCLCIVASLIGDVLNIVDFMYDIPFIGTVWSTVLNVINSLINLVVLIFCILGLVNNVNGKEANVPLANKFADWALGVINQNTNFQQGQPYGQAQNFNQQAQNFNPQAQNFSQGVNQQPQNQNPAQQNNQNQQ